MAWTRAQCDERIEARESEATGSEDIEILNEEEAQQQAMDPKAQGCVSGCGAAHAGRCEKARSPGGLRPEDVRPPRFYRDAMQLCDADRPRR